MAQAMSFKVAVQVLNGRYGLAIRNRGNLCPETTQESSIRLFNNPLSMLTLFFLLSPW